MTQSDADEPDLKELVAEAILLQRIRARTKHTSAKYRFRYFFDVWAGDCLWSANEAANESFGYPVQLNKLPLSDKTIHDGECLIGRLRDAATSESLGYTLEPDGQLDDDATAFLECLQNELGTDYEVLDERHA